MVEAARLGSLLEMYDRAIAELMSWHDPSLADLIVRLEMWRTATELERMFVDERDQVAAV